MPEFLSTAATALAATNNTINVTKAATRLGELLPGGTTVKEHTIRNLSLQRTILPTIRADNSTGKIVRMELFDLLVGGYRSLTRGETHVVYGRSSIGKTSACAAFVSNFAKETNCQALMITDARKGTPYLTHIASLLNVDEVDALYELVAGMRTVDGKPASILILDEMNDVGDNNCNIELVDSLMRNIYSHEQQITLYVVTQAKEVADALCQLNEWQKIGPLDGMTDPTRQEVLEGRAPLPSTGDPTPWKTDILEWSEEQLTTLIQNDPKFKDAGFELNDKKNIVWLQTGMTPTSAIRRAEILLEETKQGRVMEAVEKGFL